MSADRAAYLAGQAVQDAAELVRRQLEAVISGYDLPSVIYRPKLSLDGDRWVALYGDNPHDGVVGIGASPADAMWQFDIAGHKRIEPTNATPGQGVDNG